mgnify:CR=1 FL=1
MVKYQVVLNGKVLSTHKSRDLAEKALTRWQNKHTAERRAFNAKHGWLDSSLRRTSGIYHVREV